MHKNNALDFWHVAFYKWRYSGLLIIYIFMHWNLFMKAVIKPTFLEIKHMYMKQINKNLKQEGNYK